MLDVDQAEALEHTVARAQRLLAGRVVWNVNTTAHGGGVAEMLTSLIAYTRAAGVDARWVVIEGGPEFFCVTKRIHDRLHGAIGDGGPLEQAELFVYQEAMDRNLRAMDTLVRPGDIALLHDPQTAGVAGPLRDRGLRVVWRCHVGVDHANDEAHEAWRFLLPFVRNAEMYVFSRSSYGWDDLDRDRQVLREVPGPPDRLGELRPQLTDLDVLVEVRRPHFVRVRPQQDALQCLAASQPGGRVVSRGAEDRQ